MKTKILTLFLVAGCVFLMASSCEVTTANLTDVAMCSETQEFKCAEETDTFATTTPIIYCTAVLNNAVEGTQVTASWYYLEEGETFIDAAAIEASDPTMDLEFSLSKPTNDWPVGNYRVDLQVGSEAPVSTEFEVQ